MAWFDVQIQKQMLLISGDKYHFIIYFESDVYASVVYKLH